MMPGGGAVSEYAVGTGPAGGSSVTASAPQRLSSWTQVALIALGFFAVDEYRGVNQNTLHAFRAPSAQGTASAGFNQLVLVDGEVDAVRVNHNKALMFGRPAPVAAPVQRLQFFPKANSSQDAVDDQRQVNQNLLHAFRSIAPAVSATSQPYFLWPKIKVDSDEEADAQRVNQQTLHAFRWQSITVSGTVPVAYSQVVFVDGEQQTPRVDNTLLNYFRSATTPPAANPGQPWQLWRRLPFAFEAEEDARRVDNQVINALRSAALITGFSWIKATEAPSQEVEQDAQRSDHTLLHRYRRAPAPPAASQPWPMWSRSYRQYEAEDDYRRVDQQTLNAFRSTIAATGFSWIKATDIPSQELDPDAQRIDHNLLHRYRQVTPAAIPGQPWYMWPAAVADQSVEPNPVVTDHAAALYPFRPHPAIEPIPVVSDQKVGGDDKPPARKHRGFDLAEWKKSRKIDDDIERTIRRVWAEIKGEAPAQVFEEAAKVIIAATPKTIRARREVDWQAFTREWENVYRLMQVYDDWQREEDDIEFLLLNG